MYIFANPFTVTIQLKNNADLGVATGIFHAIAKENIVFYGLVLDGNKANQGATARNRGILLANCSNIQISNCKIINQVWFGIDSMGVDGLQISDCIASENGVTWLSWGTGIYVRNSGARESDNVSIVNVICNYNGNLTVGGDGCGIQIAGQGARSITNAMCNYNARYGIKSEGGNLTITNAHCNYNDFGISVSTGFTANSTQIIGCEALGNSIYGIYTTAPCTISNCETAYSGSSGIRVEGASGAFQGLRIIGCNSHDNGVHGIDIRGVNYTIIQGCHLYDLPLNVITT